MSREERQIVEGEREEADGFPEVEGPDGDGGAAGGMDGEEEDEVGEAVEAAEAVGGGGGGGEAAHVAAGPGGGGGAGVGAGDVVGGGAVLGGMWAAALPLGVDMAASQQALVDRKRQLQQERNELAKEAKAAERKRFKLIEKARGLSDDDLMSIVAQRAVAKAKAAANPKARPKAKGKAKAKAKAKAHADGGAAEPAEE